jgi:hypothetical protein
MIWISMAAQERTAWFANVQVIGATYLRTGEALGCMLTLPSKLFARSRLRFKKTLSRIPLSRMSISHSWS